MKKITSFLVFMLFAALIPNQIEAQQEVLYLNASGSSSEDGQVSAPGDDAITRMLEADPNFNVTAGIIDGGGTITPADLSPFDLIIIQEDNSSGNNAFKSSADGPLAPKNIAVPVIYCKSEAFRNGNATITTAAAINGNRSSISVTVPQSNQSNAMFSGIDFTNGDDIRLFYEAKNGNGTDPGNIAIKVLNGLEMNPVAPTLATTPEVADVNSSAVINYIPEGTVLGTGGDTANKDLVIFAFAHGVQRSGDGVNITSEALTIWRNAAYILTGQTPPTELYENPDELSLVLYLNNANAQQEQGTSAPGDDAITRMLNGDKNFMVVPGTIVNGVPTLTDGGATANLNDYNLVIIQESVSSGDNAFKSSANGDLAPKNLTVPVIYCKSEAFRVDRATLSTSASIATNTSGISVTVDPTNHDNVLFNGIDFTEGNDIRLFLETADGNGTEGTQGLKVLNNLEISPAAGTLATTPEVIDPASSIVINYFPEGTQLGTDAGDVSTKDIVAFAFGYGPQVRGDGTNVTSELLTIWRNAAYMLTERTVPTELFENPVEPELILYVNKTGKTPAEGASALNNDPIFRMLQADPNFFVTYVESDEDGSGIPDLSGFDLVIAQETFGSGDALWKPGGTLGVKDVTIPIIYNKSWAFRNGLAVTETDATVTPTQHVSVTAAIPVHPLFGGIDFSGGNDIRIFAETANDDGSAGEKSIDVLTGIDITPAGAGSLLTVPEITEPTTSMLFNYLPANTQLGEAATDVLNVDAVTFAFNYGAIIRGDGANISPEALTLWRNAAYALIYGLSEVPDTLVENPDFVLSIDKAGEVSNVSSNVRAIGNRIYVSDVKLSTEINIYSLSGALVKTIKTNNDTNFEFNTGLWIATVKTSEGAKAVKLLIQ